MKFEPIASQFTPLFSMEESTSPIATYNKYLVANDLKPDVLEYMREIARIGGKLDISFATELHTMVHKQECCIPNDFLVVYGVLQPANLGQNTRHILEQYEFVEGHDYLLMNVNEQKGGRGGHNKKTYTLHPRAFKICLMRAKNTRKYAEYYILLEEALVSYREYQVALETKRRVDAEKRSSELQERLDIMLAESRRQHGELLSGIGDVKTELKVVQHQNRGLDAKVSILAESGQAAADKLADVADRLAEAAHDLAPPPLDDEKFENLAVIKLPGKAYGYRFACLNTANLRREEAKIGRTEPAEDILLTIRCVPNANSLYLRLVERLSGQIEMMKTGGPAKRFRLRSGFTEKALLEHVRAEHEARKGDCQDLAHGAKARSIVIKRTVETTVKTTVKIVPACALSDKDVEDLLGELLN